MRSSSSLISLLIVGVLFAPSGGWAQTITEFALSTADSGATDIVTGPDGALWFTEANTNKIGTITTGGTITEYDITTSDSMPDSIVVGGDNRLWFTETAANKIGAITTAGVVTEYDIPTEDSEPRGITLGPDGRIWFTEFAGNKIGAITASGTITEYELTNSGSGPREIVSGPDDRLWFTEQSGNRIGRITTTGTIREFDVPSAAAQPVGIAIGPDENLWFTEFAGNRIGRVTTDGVFTEYNLSTAGSQPFSITSGPPGTPLWFTELANNKIGQIAPDGTITTETTVTTAASGPAGITLGPDGNLWFVESAAAGNRVAKVAPADILEITSTSPLTEGVVGSAYSGSLTASGGTTPYSWTVNGTLPDGLSLSTAGVFSGIPTTRGEFEFQIQLTDSHSIERVKDFSIATAGIDLILHYPALRLTKNRSQVQVRVRAANTGDLEAGAFSVRVYLSEDNELDLEDDLLIVDEDIAGLDPQEHTRYFKGTVDKRGNTGNYLVACVDCDNVVGEAVETNNELKRKITRRIR